MGDKHHWCVGGNKGEHRYNKAGDTIVFEHDKCSVSLKDALSIQWEPYGVKHEPEKCEWCKLKELAKKSCGNDNFALETFIIPLLSKHCECGK